jgi:lycopene beta-cyclase
MDPNIIIVGGGCAGMQLIYQLLQLPLEQTGTILLLERATEPAKKSWCFWSKEPTLYEGLVSKKWSKISFASANKQLTESIHPYQYNYINSDDFFQFHEQVLRDSKRVIRVKAEVKELISENTHVRVLTDQGEFKANLVYDSRIEFDRLPESANVLWQHFKGFFIETKEAIFDPETAILMDFSIDQGDAVHFMYVLPFSSTQALVEFTVFSKLSAYQDEEYDRYLKAYIDQKFNTSYKVLRVESGRIPMTDFNFSSAEDLRICLIGSAAGAIKPTTGYAFNRIRKDTRDLVKCLDNSTLGPRTVFRKKRFRLYDKLLLMIIRDEPHQVRRVMEQLFYNNPFRRILDFLDEESSLRQEITIFSRLPIRLFLKQLFKHVFAR